MRIGDIVGRKSYNKDIIFKITNISNNIALLEGVFIRLVATSPLYDLVLISHEELSKKREEDESYYKLILNNIKNNTKHITGKILHLDSDPNYLEKCLKIYRDLGIYAYGVNLKESEFAYHINSLIKEIQPDIIILTGHDSYNKRGIFDLNNYSTTKDYIKAIIEIRKDYSKDDIFVFAGACQSNFEALIAAGANFASSPNRVLIDAYDPAIIGVKASTTSLTKIISLGEITNHTETKGGISGVESYGKMRLLL